MPCKYCGILRVALWSACMLVSVLARAASFTHWLVTEEGKIEFQIGSPFNLHQPFNLHALLQQEDRVSSLQILRDELLNFRSEFEGFGKFDSLEENFFALDPECRNVPSITTFDLYVSTVLPLDHKQISLSDHLDLSHSRLQGEPYCVSPLDYSVYALEHLEGVQERYSLIAPAESSVLASVNMKIETFGNLVHHALKKNSTSWVLLDLATLYWRARGNLYNAVECIRRALHYSPLYAADIAYLNLANILHRSEYSEDAIVPLTLAIEISPDVNVLHYTLGNVFVSLGEFNDSIPEYRYSLSLEPTSEPVLSVYSSVLCEIRKIESSMEYSRKLDETQAKLNEFYDKVEQVKRSHIVEKGHRGQWDLDTSRRRAGKTCSAKSEDGKETSADRPVTESDKAEEEERVEIEDMTMVEGRGAEEEEGERVSQKKERKMGRNEDDEKSDGVSGTIHHEGESARNEESEHEGKIRREGNEERSALESIADISVTKAASGAVDPSPNGTASSIVPRGKSGSRLRLVLRPLSKDECSDCDLSASVKGSPPVAQSSDSVASRSCIGSKIGPPVCRLPSPFLNYSRYPSGYCAETREVCAKLERLGRPGANYCEVKGGTTRVTYTRENLPTKGSTSLDCALDVYGQSDCLRTLQEQLRKVEQRRREQKEVVLRREQERREMRLSEKVKKADSVSDKPSTNTVEKAATDNIAKLKGGEYSPEYQSLEFEKADSVPEKQSTKKAATNKNVGLSKSKGSEYSPEYHSLEFLPYNPLPTEMEDLIFPERSRPLAIFDDPYWPSKANCIKLVESLKGTSKTLSSFTGTYLSPEARGVETGSYFKVVPYPVPPYLRQQPRCTDIVELPFSLRAMDHLYPVMYRSQLKGNTKQKENGLRTVLTNTVSSAMGKTLSFEESGEAVYAAMVKNGPNWALFTVASVYWRVSGNPQHSIECLRRSLHYSPNSAKDVGYIGLANVFHRHGFMNEAIIASRAGLDVVGHSPVSHYTLAGIYLTLRDYTAASLHLRTALHQQPTFEHALSALRLVRCSLKFKEEQEQLRLKLTRSEGKQLKKHESTFTTDLNRAMESLRDHARIRQPPTIIKPPEVVSREGSDGINPYTGEDAVRYMTNLALFRDKRKRETELEGEKERKEREEIEKRLREEIMKVENDGLLEEFIKRKRRQEGDNEFVQQMGYEPSQVDITPLMRQVASRIQAENNNYDPQLIAQSRAEIEAELREIVVASARAITNNQSPVQHTTPVRIISHDKQRPLAAAEINNNDKSDAEEIVSDEKSGKITSEQKDDNALKADSPAEGEKVDVESESKENELQKAKKTDSVKRYPGYRPWPSLQDCAAMSLPKTLLFTSTWLSVTAKRVRVDEHIDFDTLLENATLRPYCHTNFPESTRTFSNLAGMSGVPLVEQYKPERGLMEVLCNLSGSYRSVEDVATRINISMTKNGSSWILSNLAALYWRVAGDGEMAINCLKHSLHYSDETNKEVALVSLANVLYRMGHDSDATAVMQHSLEVNPKLVVNHFTMANLLAARGFAAEAASYFESTLQFQPRFEPAAERLKAVRCISLLKHIQEKREKEEKRQREYEAELERQLYERRKAMGHFN